MTEHDEERFERIMKGLFVCFGGEMSEEKTELYFRALADFSIQQLEHAATCAIRELKWFPKPAELRQFIEGTQADRANDAWDRAVKAFRKGGYYRSVVFEDGYIGSALQAVFGGWVQFADYLHTQSDEMIASKRKEFLSAYRTAERERKLIQYMAGATEIENRNSVGSWKRGRMGETYRQQVCVCTAEPRLVDVRFETCSGRLLSSIPQMLKSASAELAPNAVKLLPASTESQQLTPEEVQEQIRQFTGKVAPQAKTERKPVDVLRRVRELRNQAEAIGAEDKLI